MYISYKKKYMVQYVVYTLYGCTNLCVGALYLFYLRGSMIHEQKNDAQHSWDHHLYRAAGTDSAKI